MTTSADMVPKSTGAKKGSSGADVQRVQRYLTRFGYLDSEVLDQFGIEHAAAAAPAAKQGTFDDHTETALVAFQDRFGLEPTGKVDSATLAQMKQPRCGFPDGVASFVAQGNKWSTTSLRYGFVNFCDDLTQAQVRGATSAAFGYWSAVTPLTFREVPNSDDPEIRIRFVAGDHGDGSPFDGPGSVLAHAYYPPPNGGDIAGDSHFDEDETWSVDLPASGVDYYTVAAHEFGHALGLAHSGVGDALMYPYYGGPHRFLDQDDIDGIQSIYGSQQTLSTTISRVYSTPHTKNAWAVPQGMGWHKIDGTSTDGVTNSFAALVSARTSGKKVRMRITEGVIDFVYL